MYILNYIYTHTYNNNNYYYYIIYIYIYSSLRSEYVLLISKLLFFNKKNWKKFILHLKKKNPEFLRRSLRDFRYSTVRAYGVSRKLWINMAASVRILLTWNFCNYSSVNKTNTMIYNNSYFFNFKKNNYTICSKVRYVIQ